MLDWGEGISARPRPRGAARPRAMGPILGRAQDDLQVLGQGADDCLDVQPRPLQRRLLHGELVALCPNLQGQRWSGAGDLHIWLAEVGQGWEASHQPLPKFQDQIHDLHLGLVLHPDLEVLRGQDGTFHRRGSRPALGLCPRPLHSPPAPVWGSHPSVLSRSRSPPSPPHRWPRGAGPPASGPSLCAAVGTSHQNGGT